MMQTADPKAFFHDCLYVDETPAGLVPRRFTEEQYAHWHTLGEVRYGRARAVAGATLRFVTSASEIRFSYHVASLCGEKMCFDLFEGDRLTSSFSTYTTTGSGQVVFRRLFSGEEGRKKEVTIYLPFTAELALCGFEFGEDAEPVCNEPAHRVIWLGDSISQGMHAVHSSLALVARLQRLTGFDIVNQGVGGCGFKDISVDFTYGPYKPDRLAILLGTNDTGALLADEKKYFERMDLCLDKAAEAFGVNNIRLLTPFWRADTDKPEIGVPYYMICDRIRNEAAKRGIPLAEGYLANPRATEFFWDNRLHPNDIGFGAIMDALKDVLND